MNKIFLTLLIFAISFAVSAADDFKIGIPVKCKLNEDCFIQNYVDVHRDSNPKSPRDYTCGSLVYAGHKGTDFRIKTNADIKNNVEIIAAADGTVKAIRDDMEEGHGVNSAAIKGRECGNGVVIEHGNGWETQYCHMKKGSIKVRVGQELSRGDTLGYIGLSGKTQFPHLHISVRKDGEIIDPFVGEVNKTTKCGGELKSLWTSDAADKVLPYRSTGLLGASFSSDLPSQKAVMDGKHKTDKLKSTIDKLIFWVYLFGVRKGDEEEFVIKDPNGRPIFRKRMQSVKKNKATWLSFVGKKVLPNKQKDFHQPDSEKQHWYSKIFKAMGLEGKKKSRGFLTEGTYVAQYRLIRKDKDGNSNIVIAVERDVKIEFDQTS